MGPQRLVTFVISALEMFLLTYLLTAVPHSYALRRPFHIGLAMFRNISCKHISTAERNRINKFFRKAYRRHLGTQIFDIDTLIETTDSSNIS